METYKWASLTETTWKQSTKHQAICPILQLLWTPIQQETIRRGFFSTGSLYFQNWSDKIGVNEDNLLEMCLSCLFVHRPNMFEFMNLGCWQVQVFPSILHQPQWHTFRVNWKSHSHRIVYQQSTHQLFIGIQVRHPSGNIIKVAMAQWLASMATDHGIPGSFPGHSCPLLYRFTIDGASRACHKRHVYRFHWRVLDEWKINVWMDKMRVHCPQGHENDEWV